MSDLTPNPTPGGHNPSDLRAEIDALIAQGIFDIAGGRLAGVWGGYPAAAQRAAERVVRGYEQWIGAFRKQGEAALIIHSLERPSSPSLGILDSQSDAGQSGLIRDLDGPCEL